MTTEKFIERIKEIKKRKSHFKEYDIIDGMEEMLEQIEEDAEPVHIDNAESCLEFFKKLKQYSGALS